jgi:C4-dicarboxylate-specific signal transduction histidine kinase
MELRQIIDRAASDRRSFSAEHRLLTANGAVKHLRVVAHPAHGEEPQSVDFIGAVTDITERKRAEEERERLRQLEADLARVNRVSIMGELAASLGHEINQPIAAAAINARACVRWLQREPPEIDEARQTISRIVNDLNRVGGIIDRNRSLYGRGTPQREPIDLNEIIRHMVVLLRDAANRQSILIRTDLDAALPMTTADRVQL